MTNSTVVLILLALLISSEIGFLVFEAKKPAPDHKTWTIRRLVVNAGQIVLYLISLMLPGIDTSFRFMGLIILLTARIAIAGIFAIARKKNKGTKKTGLKVMSLVISSLLIGGSMVPALIFTDYEGRPTTGPYTVKQCQAIAVDESRVETFENDGSYREVPMYFFTPAEAKEGEKFPLVIFSHGAFGYYQSNASSYMELASRGYVVVSIEHPYHSFFTHDTEGKLITVDPEFINNCMNVNNSITSEEDVYKISHEWIELRAADMNFALDTLIAGADANDISCLWFADAKAEADVKDVLTHIDTDKIGLMGHSMGGATAVELGRTRDDIDAVIDIDGTMLGSIVGAENGSYIVNEEPYETPLLEFENESSHWELIELEKIGYSYPNIKIKETASTYYCTYVEGTLHMDYTDLPLFAPLLAKNLGSGDVDHALVSDTVNALEVEFFDCYLKGEGQFTVNESYPGVK